MSNVTSLKVIKTAEQRKAAELQLIRTSVAKDCDDDEFLTFMHWAEHLGLDPLRRDVYAFVFNKWTKGEDNEDGIKGRAQKERQLTLVVAIQGYRKVAAATGCYRPSEDEYEVHLTADMQERQALFAAARKLMDLDARAKQFELIDKLYPIDPTNPEGIERIVSYVWQHSHGEWHRVAGVAYWAEFAPMRQQYDKTAKCYVGPKFLDPKKEQWTRSPRNQLAKCSESQALRKAWPDKFSNTYEHAELDRVTSDMDALELIAEHQEEQRLIRVGRAADAISFDVGGENHDEAFGPIVPIEPGKVADNLLAYMDRFHENPAQIKDWWNRNRFGIRDFVSLVQNKKIDGEGWLTVRRRYEEIMENAQAKSEADKAQGDAA